MWNVNTYMQRESFCSSFLQKKLPCINNYIFIRINVCITIKNSTEYRTFETCHRVKSTVELINSDSVFSDEILA